MDTNSRVGKHKYYHDIADAIASRSTCMKRRYGAIIVKNDEIIATGYNGAPRGRKNCMDIGFCTRIHMNIPSGERYELCRSVHAEANAIISAGRKDMIGSTLYLAGRYSEDNSVHVKPECCSMCKRMIINAGIESVITMTNEGELVKYDVRDWIYNDESLPNIGAVCIKSET